MTTIYRKIKIGELQPNDEVVAHDGKGWVFATVESVDEVAGEAELTPNTRPMLTVEAAGKQADKEASYAVRNARRAGVDLASSILSSEQVEIEEFDTDAWPSTDRTERRELGEFDPLARAIQKRLYPGDTMQSRDVWLTTVFMTGGYSEFTMEQEYGLTVECGQYIANIGHGNSHVPLDDLLDWLDGKDSRAVVTIKKKGEEA